MSDVLITNAVYIGLMIVGFIGTSLYLRGNISARLDAHDTLLEKNGKAIDSLNALALSLEKSKVNDTDHDRDIGDITEAIDKLFDRANELEKNKVDENVIIVWKSELRADFLSFKDDMRINIKEFKEDIRNDINNALIIIKKTNGIK